MTRDDGEAVDFAAMAERTVPASVKKLRGSAHTWNWALGHPCLEVLVKTSASTITRGWLWQILGERIGVILYGQSMEDPRVSFWPIEQVEPVRVAKHWYNPLVLLTGPHIEQGENRRNIYVTQEDCDQQDLLAQQRAATRARQEKLEALRARADAAAAAAATREAPAGVSLW